MRKKFFILFLALAVFLDYTFVYSAQGLSLQSLVKEATEKNPEIIAAKKRWEAAKARVPQAKALASPTIGLSFKKIPRGSLKLDETASLDRMLSISQMFPFFGKLSLKGKVSLVESQMIASAYKHKELEIIEQVKSAYYNLYLNYREIELREQSLKFLEGIAKIAEAKYIVGDLPQESLFKIDLEIARLSNAIRNLSHEQSAKKTYLNALLNRPPESQLGRPELEEDRSFNKDLDTLYKSTLENHPELLIFFYAIEKNKFSKDLAKKGLLPDLMAEIGLRGLGSGSFGVWDLMLAFTVPFWFWTKQRYEVKEAIANLEEAKVAYEAMKNKALAQTKDFAMKIEIAKDKIRLYQSNLIPILESSIESSLAAFRTGKGDLMMLLDNERMLIETKLDYYKAQVEYHTNLADLEKRVGVELREVKK